MTEATRTTDGGLDGRTAAAIAAAVATYRAARASLPPARPASADPICWWSRAAMAGAGGPAVPALRRP